MAVLKIVANLQSDTPSELMDFYRDVFGMEQLMDLGWIATHASLGREAPVQLSAAREGGSGTALPHLSIEVDDLDAVLERAKARAAPVEYGPILEPWGVRRFYLRDPAGNLLNVLEHMPGE